MKEDKKLSVTGNVLWNTVGNVIYLGFQWLTTIVIAWIVGYEQLGMFSLAMSITNVGFSIAGWGVRNYQVSDIHHKYSEASYIIARFITCALSYTGIFLFGFLQNYSAEQRIALYTYMLFRIGESLIDVIHGIFQQQERMDYVGKSFIFRGILNFIVLIITLCLGHNVIFGIISMVISTAAVMLLWDYTKLTQLGIRIITNKIKTALSLIIECTPLAVQHILFTSYATIPRFFLERSFGQETLGIYASITTPVVIIQAMANFIMIPYATVIAKCVHAKQKIKLVKNIFLVFGMILGFGLAAAAIMLLFGEWGLNLLFGKKAADEAGVLLPSVIAVIFVAFDSFLNIILVVFRQKKGLLCANLCSVLTAMLVAEFLVHRFCLYGASYVHIIILAVHFVIALSFSVYEIRKL